MLISLTGIFANLKFQDTMLIRKKGSKLLFSEFRNYYPIFT